MYVCHQNILWLFKTNERDQVENICAPTGNINLHAFEYIRLWMNFENEVVIKLWINNLEQSLVYNQM